MIPQAGKVLRGVCPNSPGAKDWSPSAFSKATGLLYVPHNNLCMDWETKPVNYIAGTPYIGVNPRFYPGQGGNAGEFMAWDPGRPAQGLDHQGALAGLGRRGGHGRRRGVLRKPRRLVQGGRRQHRPGALEVQDRLGDHRPAHHLPRPDGRQYVAILSGVGGWVGSIVTNNLDPRDPTAQKGFANMTGELKKITQPGGMLYVFA
jgi:hypothetical protein